MYGLLLDSIQKFLREKYGEHYWVVIRRRAKLSNHWFVTHEVYSDTVMSDLVDAAAATLGEPRDLVMQMFGEYFVQTIGRYGYVSLSLSILHVTSYQCDYATCMASKNATN